MFNISIERKAKLPVCDENNLEIHFNSHGNQEMLFLNKCYENRNYFIDITP